MKKLLKLAGVLTMLSLIFGVAGCNSDDDDDDGPQVKKLVTTGSLPSVASGGNFTLGDNFKVYALYEGAPTITGSDIQTGDKIIDVTEMATYKIGSSVIKIGSALNVSEGTKTVTISYGGKETTTSLVITEAKEDDDDDVVTGDEVTLEIEEKETGFINTTGSLKEGDTQWIGYSGKGYVESLTAGKDIVYTVTASGKIKDAKIAVHYGMWNAQTQVRGVLVKVNGTVINSGSAIKTTYTNKGQKGAVVEGRWIDSGYVEGVTLKKGANTIIITGASGEQTYNNEKYTPSDDGCLPNIDYLIVVGRGIEAGGEAVTTSNYMLAYSSENTTAGSVTSDTENGSIEEGTSVTLKASANSGWKFECWSDGTTTSEYTFAIAKDTKISAHFIPANFDKSTINSLVGYATITSDTASPYTITGGAGGETITIASLEDITSNELKLSSNTPYIVKFTNGNRITTSDNVSIIMSIGSNKTIYGATSGAGLKNIEMRVSGSNVIIRNLIFGEVIADDFWKGSGNDALSLNGASHVWVDHCELFSHLSPKDNAGNVLTYSKGTNTSADSESDFKKDWYDGLLDIKNGATWITVSNCYLHDHWKAFLCGSGDSHDDGDSNMRLTIVGCFFKDINSRQPLFRWGKAHIYNNYFLSENTEVYRKSNCIDVRVGSAVLAEANYFKGVKNAIGIDLANGGTNGKEEYSFPSTNQLTDCVNNDIDEGSSSYAPPYNYAAATASTNVEQKAGANLTGLNY